jgi:hypothetical protein
MPEQAVLRYETTSEYDGKFDYDNFFIPAQISFFHNDKKLQSLIEKEPNLQSR